MSCPIIHYDVKISGRVQGVGYRAFASKVARNLGLKGYVKNMMDGSVYIEAEGTREILDQFIIRCKAGPGWAYVEKVTKSEAPVQSYKEFSVKY